MKALNQANPTQFDYEMTDDSSSNDRSRWTEWTIEHKLQDCGGTPANIYVCGPPKMNQTFEMAFNKLTA